VWETVSLKGKGGFVGAGCGGSRPPFFVGKGRVGGVGFVAVGVPRACGGGCLLLPEKRGVFPKGRISPYFIEVGNIKTETP